MNEIKRKYYLLNYIFVLGIILLFINDHFLKWQFSNWITGKLSDFVGLLIFPFFLTFLFPKSIKLNVLFTGVFFLFWKSPFSQSFIDFYNSIAFIEITRIVDYSDYVALIVLPFSYFYLSKELQFNKILIGKIKVHPILVLFPSIIIFMATSPPRSYFFHLSHGNLTLYNLNFRVGLNKENLLIKMKESGINVKADTLFERHHRTIPLHQLNHFYVEQMIINEDTIRDLEFTMRPVAPDRTKLYFNSMNISKDIPENEVKNELRKYYTKLLRAYLKTNIK